MTDSRRLLFNNERRGISMADIQSGNVQEIISLNPDRLEVGTLSHDRRWIYFSRTTTEADIWMLTLTEKR
jgi:hypothetical protein